MGTLNFSFDFHIAGNYPLSCLFLQGWSKLVIFKKQTHALYPWVRGEDKGAPDKPLMIQGFVFF